MKTSAALAAALLIMLLTAASSRAQVVLKVGDATGAPGAEAVVPILISGSQKAGPMQFILDYDRRMLEAIADPPDAEPRGVVFGSLVSGGMIATNTAEPGELKIALRTEEPITQDGELLRVRFRVKGKRGDTCTLNILVPEVWEKATLYEMAVRVEPGAFTVGGLGLSMPLLIAVVAALLLSFLILKMRKKRSAPAVPVTPASAPAPQPAAASSAGADDPLALLKKLKDMQSAGFISAEEFEAKKKDLLSRM